MSASKRRIMWIAILGMIASLHALALWFIFRYTTTFPLAIDEWLHIVPRSVRLLEGEMTFRDFISAKLVYDAPPAIFFYSWSLILPNVLFLKWELQVGSFTNYLLATINTGILLYLLTREQKQLLPYLIIPLTALLLAIQQRWNLIVGMHNAIHLLVMFILLPLMCVYRPHQRVRNVLLAVVVAFIGVFSSLVSWLSFVILLPALILLGYRQWQAYAIYGGGLLLTILALSFVPGFTLGENSNYFAGSENTSFLSNIGGYILFTLTYLGAIFNHGVESNIMISIFMGIFGLAGALANLVYLWRFTEYRRFVSVCALLMLYSGMFGGMTSIGRLHQFGIRWGLTHHYMTSASLFWVGLSGLIALSLWHMITTQQQKQALILTNLLVAMLGTVFYINGVIGMIRVAEQHTEWVAEQETCIQRAANGEDVGEGCEVVGGIATLEMIQTLAEYELTGFAPNR